MVYRGEIHTTPLVNQSLIDGDRVRDLVSAEFQKAGFTPADTDTGAVIITGESARKENSALVLEKHPYRDRAGRSRRRCRMRGCCRRW